MRSPYDNNWDGKDNGNRPLAGIYYYILEAVNEKSRYTGTASIYQVIMSAI
jgi:hypothetical protein